MTPEELREKIRETIRRTPGAYMSEAGIDAAIRVVLKAASDKLDSKAEELLQTVKNTEDVRLIAAITRDCSNFIRALMPQDTEDGG